MFGLGQLMDIWFIPMLITAANGDEKRQLLIKNAISASYNTQTQPQQQIVYYYVSGQPGQQTNGTVQPPVQGGETSVVQQGGEAQVPPQAQQFTTVHINGQPVNVPVGATVYYQTIGPNTANSQTIRSISDSNRSIQEGINRTNESIRRNNQITQDNIRRNNETITRNNQTHMNNVRTSSQNIQRMNQTNMNNNIQRMNMMRR